MNNSKDRSVHEGRSIIAVATDLLSRKACVHTVASSPCAGSERENVHACVCKRVRERERARMGQKVRREKGE